MTLLLTKYILINILIKYKFRKSNEFISTKYQIKRTKLQQETRINL